MSFDERLEKLMQETAMLQQVAASHEAEIVNLVEAKRRHEEAQQRHEEMQTQQHEWLVTLSRIVVLLESRVRDIEGGRQ